MSNALNILMSVNQENLKKPTKEVEIPRLSEICGEPFKVTVKALNMSQLKETVKSVDSEDQAARLELACITARYGLVDPLVTNKDLQKQMSVQNWEELLNRLFLAGEIITIAEEIFSISDVDGASMKKKSAKKKKAEKLEEEVE